MCVTPTSGSTSCGRPAASSAAESCSVWAATTLSSARPWMRSSGRVSSGGERQERVRVVHLGLHVRVAEVALGVVRVVEPPFGDRRAGDGGVEHVGPSQHGERREVPAEAPATDRDPVEVELGVAFGGGVERVRSGRRARRWRGRRAPIARSASRGPGVPRPSATSTAKPWSANHCDVRERVVVAHARVGRAARRTGRAAPAAATRRGRGGAARRRGRRRRSCVARA